MSLDTLKKKHQAAKASLAAMVAESQKVSGKKEHIVSELSKKYGINSVDELRSKIAELERSAKSLEDSLQESYTDIERRLSTLEASTK